MQNRDFYTTQELADKLRVNVMTIYRYIKAKKLNAYRVGKKFCIEKKSLIISSRKKKQNESHYFSKDIHKGAGEAGNSLPAQLDRLQIYIHRNPKLALGKEFTFDESAHKEVRVKFDEVIEYIE
jgi:excisionase family DNA binding protein